jgi:Cobalamin biosynthesis protein CobT (nicotinate-mononucleotide:5, 6-dimethylbenzimidazole phosphoribosyltransferase)
MAISITFAEIGYWLLLAAGSICLLILFFLAAAFVFTFFIRFHAEISIKTASENLQNRVYIWLKMPLYKYVIFDYDDSDDSESAPASDSDSETESQFESENPIEPFQNEIESQRAETPAAECAAKKEDGEFNSNIPTDSSDSSDSEEESDSDFEDYFEKLSDFSDLSDSYEELQRYVDLSDLRGFVSDSIAAAIRISKVLSRFISDCLIRADIQKLSMKTEFGLSNPADTAFLFGGLHSFKSSVYAYLISVESNSRSSRRRKKAGELAAEWGENIIFIPEMEHQKFEAEADLSVSFRLSNIFFPILRFVLNKNTRWVLRRYIYVYFIRQWIKVWKSDRKQKKENKKKSKTEKQENENLKSAKTI